MKRHITIQRLILLMLLTISIIIYILLSNDINRNKQQKIEFIEETINYQDTIFNAEDYSRFKSINEDFYCYLHFDSQIISEPVIRYSNNSYYLRKDFFKNYNYDGCIFIDYRCNQQNNNIIIYGHIVFNNDSEMFSPLLSLTKQNYYQENKHFSIYFENEKRDYVITHVYICNLKDNYNYLQTSFNNEEEFNDFIIYPNNKNLISSPDILVFGDKMITFQTCVKTSNNQRLIVLAKQIDSNPY